MSGCDDYAYDGSVWTRLGSRYLVLLFAIALAVVAGTSLVMAEGPSLTVDTPVDGIHTDSPTMAVTGTTDPSITVRVHTIGDRGEAWNNSTSLGDGSFNISIDLVRGYQNLTVQADDGMGNTTDVTRAVVFDGNGPDLEIYLEYLNGTRIPWSEEHGAYAVRDREIVINGTYKDDYSALWNISLYINGEYLYIFPSQYGRIYFRHQLELGVNKITVEAVDASGGKTIAIRYVYMDNIPPHLDITAPLDNGKYNTSTYNVTGETEPNTTVDVIVQSSAGTHTYSIVSEPDGTFKVEVELFEGIQKVLVTATDYMGNPNMTDLNVVSDTIPPDFIINSPDEDPTYTKEGRISVVGVMTRGPEARVFIDLQEVANTGVFSSEVVLEEGENLIEVRAVDDVGNAKVVILTIFRDSTPPVLTVTDPSDDPLYTNNPSIHFRGMVTGAVGVEVQHKAIDLPVVLTSGTWEDGEWEYVLELGPQDLEQYILVRAYDMMGNEALSTILVILDIVPPTLTLDPIDEQITNSTPFTFTGTTDTDIEVVTVNADEFPVVNGLFSCSVDLEDGWNTMEISVRDRAGNVASITTTGFLDTTAPQFDIDAPKETTKDKVTISGTCDPDVVLVWVNQEPATVGVGIWEAKVDLKKEGKNEFLITFEDSAGNVATETITINKGAETPGFGAIASVLCLAIVVMISRWRRRSA